MPNESATTIATRWLAAAARTFGLRMIGGTALGFGLGVVAFVLLRVVRGEAGSWLWLPVLPLVGTAVLAYVSFGWGVRGAALLLFIESGLVRGALDRLQRVGLSKLGVKGMLASVVTPLYRALLARFGVPGVVAEAAAQPERIEQLAADWIKAWRRGSELIALAFLGLAIAVAFAA